MNPYVNLSKEQIEFIIDAIDDALIEKPNPNQYLTDSQLSKFRSQLKEIKMVILKLEDDPDSLPDLLERENLGIIF